MKDIVWLTVCVAFILAAGWLIVDFYTQDITHASIMQLILAVLIMLFYTGSVIAVFARRSADRRYKKGYKNAMDN